MKTTILFLLLTNFLFSQIPIQKMIKTYGDTGYDLANSIKQTIDGGYIITGLSNSWNSLSTDVWLIRTNSIGDTIWTKVFTEDNYEYGEYVQTLSTGGFTIVGRSYDLSDNDILLMETDSNGNVVWKQNYDWDDDQYAYCLQSTYDGGYVIAGVTGRFNQGFSNALLIKTNSNGDTVWTKNYGGISEDYATFVEQTSDSGFIIAGITHSYGNGEADFWLIKTDLFGDTLWTRTYGGFNTEQAYCVRQTPDNGYILCGFTYSYGAGSSDIWLIKTDFTGDTLWTKTFGSINMDHGNSVIVTSDHNYLITGTLDNDIILIKVDLQGNNLWQGKFGGSQSDDGIDIIEKSENEFIIVGGTESYGIGSIDAFMLQVDEEEFYADFSADINSGILPLQVNFNDLSTSNVTDWYWDFENDGIIDLNEQNPSWTYFNQDSFSVKLIVSYGLYSDTLVRESYIITYPDSFPNIYAIVDIPDDQGGWVNVKFARSLYDTDTLIHPDKKTEFYTVEINYDSMWTAVNSTLAYGKSYYSVLVPTTKDSTAYSNGLIDFRVIAGMDEGNFVSNVLSGYSVDNLEPNAPQNLLGVLIQDTLASLQWSANQENDLQHYLIYRSFDGLFFELVMESADTTLIDTIDISVDSVIYSIKAVDYSGNYSEYSNFVSFNISDIQHHLRNNLEFKFFQNYPNPFNPTTKIKFDIQKLEKVKIEVFNLLGQKITTLLNKQMPAGSHEAEFTAMDLPSGVYLYRIEAGEYNEVKKMILLR